MGTRVIAAILAICIVTFVGIFIWTTVWTIDPREAVSADGSPSTNITEQLSDGQLDVQVYVLGSQEVRLEIQFMPDADALETSGMRPDVSFAMTDMHMDGVAPPIELVGAGVWRAKVKLPMAGRWIVNVGFGEEFAEAEFDVR